MVMVAVAAAVAVVVAVAVGPSCDAAFTLHANSLLQLFRLREGDRRLI